MMSSRSAARDYAICGLPSDARRQNFPHATISTRSGRPAISLVDPSVTRLIAVSRCCRETQASLSDEAGVVIPSWIDPATVGSVDRTAARGAWH